MTAQSLRPWLGVRIEIERSGEWLLRDVVASWLDRKRREGLVRRWFFLWYGDEDLHVRLRIQARRSADADLLVAQLEKLSKSSEAQFRLGDQPYDRATLAFGHTRESVLAELLHAATSDLAVRLLRRNGTKCTSAERWTLTAATAIVLLRRAVPPPDLDGAVAAWVAFAAHAAHVRDSRVTNASHKRLTVLASAVPIVEVRLDNDRAARRAVALLRRVRKRGERGRFVATHALHLFCNEMGLTLPEEYDMLVTLQTFCSPPAAMANRMVAV
jgi:thiopeptide-type bacteriocin biosynthesis protein